jgi:hypothetical protein
MTTAQRLAKLEARGGHETEESNAERCTRASWARMMDEYSDFLETVERILQTVPDLYAPLIEATLSELAMKTEAQQWQFFFSGGFIGGNPGDLARECDGQGMALLKHVLRLASRHHKGARCVPAQTCEILISGACDVEFGGASMGLWECRECNYFMPQTATIGARELLLKACPACGGEPTKDFHELKKRKTHEPDATN